MAATPGNVSGVTPFPDSCSGLSLAAGEALAGTASTAAGYLLLEHGGPWGAKVMRDAVFPGPGGDGLGGRLQELLTPLGVTPLLVRRCGARHGVPSPATVMLVALGAAGGHGARRQVTHLGEVAGWDLAAALVTLRAGDVPDGWEPLGTQYLVCTHARRDPCCGRLGRPLAAALTAAVPDRTWEASHLGGHRLAANTLVLPEGVVYGRLNPADVPSLTEAHDGGRLLVGALRGRAALPPPLQAAEIGLRLATGTDAAGALTLLGTAPTTVAPSAGGPAPEPAAPAVHDPVAPAASGPAGAPVAPSTTWVSRWAAGTQVWRVSVDVLPGTGGPRPASCGNEPVAPAVRHEVTSVTAEP